ncbi:hypothetical protein [Runella sp.]|uniref:hypothetical protein n=1 Tax=Runella sp. TaxID=1960881 RepID=UPI003D0F192D
MKAKRYTISILSYLLLAFCGCKKSDYVPMRSLSCKWTSNYSVEAKVIDMVTTVHRSVWRDTAYIIRDSTPMSKYSFWLACNMPERAKKDSVKVKISGYIMTFPGIEGVQFKHGHPFELTSIKYL